MTTSTRPKSGPNYPAASPVHAPSLTVDDRCDRCGAQAYIRAVMPSGLDLLLCGHHGAEQDAALRAKGAVIQDGRTGLYLAESARSATGVST